MVMVSYFGNSLVGSVNGSALHRFQVVRVRFPASPTAVWYTLKQGVFAVANLPEKLPAYIIAWQVDSSNLSIVKKNVIKTELQTILLLKHIVSFKWSDWDYKFILVGFLGLFLYLLTLLYWSSMQFSETELFLIYWKISDQRRQESVLELILFLYLLLYYFFFCKLFAC